MKDNEEKQVSTEQYYGSVEGNSTSTVEEEQSYSLEDLHPEEPKEEKVVAPVKTSEEEIQPDPTVIEGVKASIGNSSTMDELPQTTNNLNSNKNTLEQNPKPVLSSIPKQESVSVNKPQEPVLVNKKVVNNNQLRVQNSNSQNPNTVPNAKVFYLIFGVILLFLIVGIPLYSIINSSLNSPTGVSEPIKKETDKDKDPTTPENPGNQPSTPTSNQPITFDMNLSFDKGWATNEKEINQKKGFLPTNLTGVIRCDLAQPVELEGVTTYNTTYLYYENYKLAGAIEVKRQEYPSATLYTEAKDTSLKYQTAGDKNDSLDVKITQDDKTYTITNTMKYNLQYGNSTYIEELNINLLFPQAFGTNIKTAIEQTIASSTNNGNTICGAIVTSDTGK